MEEKSILVVEDDQLLSAAIQEKLKTSGYRVLHAGDGVAGLLTAIEEQPDLILLDIVMPKMDGVEMVKQLRLDPWGKTVPVVALTNWDERSEENERFRKQVEEYCIKSDWPIQNIVDHIASTIQKDED